MQKCSISTNFRRCKRAHNAMRPEHVFGPNWPSEMVKKWGELFAEKFWKTDIVDIQGQIQDFLKEGVPKSKTDRTLAPVGIGGVWGGCAPWEAEKNCNFRSQFVRFGAFFLRGVHRILHIYLEFCAGAPTQSQAPYLCKKWRGRALL